jgi:FKBP-type peptidyl-prolyl cis-trans isomerase
LLADKLEVGSKGKEIVIKSAFYSKHHIRQGIINMMLAPKGSGIQTRPTRSHVSNIRSKCGLATLPTAQKPTIEQPSTTRRAALLSGIAALSMGSATVLLPRSSSAATAAPETPTQPAISIVSKEEGTGIAAAQIGDLVLVHYVGKLKDGTVFDSTRGGLVRPTAHEKSAWRLNLAKALLTAKFKIFKRISPPVVSLSI